MFSYPASVDSLFNELARLSRDLGGPYGASGMPASIRAAARGTFPAINIGASDDEVEVYAFASGIDTSSLDISVQRNVLTVAGERKLERQPDAEYYLNERMSGSFRRVMSLPDDVDPDKVEANYRDGVLHIRMQRSEQVYADVRGTRYRRSFSLSPELDTENVDANLGNGVLSLKIPKRAELQPRRIEVKAH